MRHKVTGKSKTKGLYLAEAFRILFHHQCNSLYSAATRFGSSLTIDKFAIK